MLHEWGESVARACRLRRAIARAWRDAGRLAASRACYMRRCGTYLAPACWRVAAAVEHGVC